MGKFDIRVAPVRLAELVSQAVKPIVPVAEEIQIQVDLSVQCDSAYKADADRLTQLVDNLLSNALKFTPRGGSIAVALSSVTVESCSRSKTAAPTFRSMKRARIRSPLSRRGDE